MYRAFKPERLFRRVGFYRSNRVTAEEVPADFAQNFSKRFRLDSCTNRVIAIPEPSSKLDLVDLTELLSKIVRSLFDADRRPDTVRQYTNLYESLLILLTAENVYTTPRILLEKAVKDTRLDAPERELEYFIFVEELFVTMLLIQRFVFPDYMRDMPIAKRFPFTVEQRLLDRRLLHKTVFSLSLEELSGALYLLAVHWHELHYNSDLRNYTRFLSTRLAELHYEERPITDEDPLTEQEETQDGRWKTATRETIDKHCWCIRSMWQKLRIHEWILERFQPGEMMDFSDADRTRLREKALRCDRANVTIDQFREECMKAMLLPGEPELYVKNNPGRSPRYDLVIDARGEMAVSRFDLQSKALMEPVATQVTDRSLFGDCIADMALATLISHYIKTHSGVVFDNYVIQFKWLLQLQEELEDQLKLNREQPVLIRSFNWFCLLYNNRHYAYDNVLDATLHWLYIICCPPFSGMLDTHALTDALKLRLYDFYPVKP